ncbi:hypothetical protein O1611_g3142 [Lasiodiplodia mahajangana]|uniref:Uncharacterized protein n=1 Tax=Lasiodiplodia mahajangana TaxID=1108764 RepID=A0ACC2JSK7_9PEZI|nr:hypothetical protein O1611_g3142 [Lasiodiplodia mahajangana]
MPPPPPPPPPSSYHPGQAVSSHLGNGALYPSPGQIHLTSPLRPYSPGWEQWKRELGERFGPHRSGVNHIAPSQSYPLGYAGGGEPSGADLARVTSRLNTATTEMTSFAVWVGSHGKHYSEPGKVTDIAIRLHHNLPDFAGLFSELAMRRGARRFLPDTSVEDIYQRGLAILSFFQSTMAAYKGPFKPRRQCSKSELAHAQRLIVKMLVHDYDKWDGLLWHVIHWIVGRRCICS